MKKLDWLKEANKTIVVAFDVDGTLVNFDDTPNQDNILLFNHFQRLGCKTIIWSSAGQEYAESWCEKLGLKPSGIRLKPLNKKETEWVDIAFDDDTKLGVVSITV